MDQSPPIEALISKHAALERALDAERNRPHPDPLVVTDIKKHKLRIKDEIAKLSTG